MQCVTVKQQLNLRFGSFFFHGMILFNQEAEREGKRKIEREWLNVRWLEVTSSSNHYEKSSINWRRSFTEVSAITTSNHSCCTFKCVLFDSLGSILSWLMYMNTTASKGNVPEFLQLYWQRFFWRNLLCKWIHFHSLTHFSFRETCKGFAAFSFPDFKAIGWTYSAS